MLKWLKLNECYWNPFAFDNAAKHGSLVNMKWLLDNHCYWDEFAFSAAGVSFALVTDVSIVPA